MLMVKHIILWQLNDEFNCDEKSDIKQGIKKNLEDLKGQIDGLIDIKIITEGLESSSADLMLDSTFESKDALKNYASHPKHVAAANGFVRPYTKTRLCLDFEI